MGAGAGDLGTETPPCGFHTGIGGASPLCGGALGAPFRAMNDRRLWAGGLVGSTAAGAGESETFGRAGKASVGPDRGATGRGMGSERRRLPCGGASVGRTREPPAGGTGQPGAGVGQLAPSWGRGGAASPFLAFFFGGAAGGPIGGGAGARVAAATAWYRGVWGIALGAPLRGGAGVWFPDPLTGGPAAAGGATGRGAGGA